MKSVRVSMLILFACLASAAFPQASPSSETGSITQRLVSLDVVVTDASGNPVPGLKERDFTVLDDKQPKIIRAFAATDDAIKTGDSRPIVIFLIDAVNPSSLPLRNAREQLERYLRQQGGQVAVPVSLVMFTEKSTQALGAPTRDVNTLLNFLKVNETGAHDIGRAFGFYGDLERLQSSLRVLEKLIAYEAKQPGRKLLIWLSSGWSLVPPTALDEKDMETAFHTIVKISTQLREARITLYSIDALGVLNAGGFRNFYYKNFLKGVTSASKVENGSTALPVFAAQSGGQVLNRSNDFVNMIATCVADTKAYYTISFDSAVASHPNEYHDLEVKIDKPGLIARTRTGYYAQPQGAAAK